MTKAVEIFARCTACRSPILFVVALLCVAANAYDSDAVTAKQPNVVFILTDDAGYREFGFMGSETAVTPNIDLLASHGVVFQQAYAMPTCSPSRAALLSGAYQQRLGYERNNGNFVDDRDDGLSPAVDTVFERLRRVGYATCVVGKWHVGAAEGWNRPAQQGVDTFFGLLGGSRNYFGVANGPAQAIRRGDKPTPTWVDEPSPAPRDPKHGRYLTDAFADEACNFIERRGSDSPFLLYLSLTAPHGPYQAKQQELERFGQLEGQQRKVAAMIASVDTAVGRVVDSLESAGLLDDTILIFSNDNGGARGHDNGELRGHKGSVYEGGVRVPLIVSGPGIDAGGIDPHPTCLMDIAYTIVSVAGGETEGFDGVDITAADSTDVRGARSLFYRHESQGVAMRQGKWKLVNPCPPGEKYGEVAQGAPGRWELYDIDADPTESNDLSASFPAVVERLQHGLTGWEAQMPKPRWGVFGKNDRNLFDHFCFEGVASETALWSGLSRWRNAESSELCTLCTQDGNACAVLEFPASSGWHAQNDLLRMSGLDFMANEIRITGTTSGRLTTRIDGNAIVLASSLGGQKPIIRNSVSRNDDTSVAAHIGLDIRALDDLHLVGDGSAPLIVTGELAGLDPSVGLQKRGSSSVELRGLVKVGGPVLVRGGHLAMAKEFTTAADVSIDRGASAFFPLLGIASSSVLTVDGSLSVGSLKCRGVLRGAGRISGPVHLHAEATLLVVGDTDESRTPLEVDERLELAGKLRLAIDGAPQLGDSFALFRAPIVSGRFSTVELPRLGQRARWDTSRLYSQGVVTVVASQPTPIVLRDQPEAPIN